MGLFSQHVYDFARLAKIKPVERLVHQHEFMRREQPKSQQKPPTVPLRQGAYSFAENGYEADGADHLRD